MNVLLYASFDPIAFSLGPVKIHWYGISYAVGIFLGWQYCLWLIRKKSLHITEKTLSDFIPFVILGIILGGRLGIALLYNFDYYAQHPMEIFYIWKPGMSFHGGLLGVILTIAWFCHRKKLSILKFGDLLATGTPIGIFFGRCANFINGELVGRPTDIPWAVIFPHTDALPRHASQLYEAALEGLILFLIFHWVAVKSNVLHRHPGFISGLFFLGYGAARIFVEFFREPDIQIGYLWGGITMGQLLSLPLIVIGIIFIIMSQRAPKPAFPHDTL